LPEDVETSALDALSAKKQLAKALGCLGIKASTFNGLVFGQRIYEIKKTLDEAMVVVTEEIKQSYHLNIPEKQPKKNLTYQPHVDRDADLATMHEAYQFLVKVYVDDAIERKKKLSKAMLTTSAISAFGQGKKDTRTAEQLEQEENSRKASLLMEELNFLGLDDPLYGSSSSYMERRGGSRRASACPIPFRKISSLEIKKMGSSLDKIQSSRNGSRKGSSSGHSHLLAPTTAQLSKRRNSAYK
jgi:hypothetical protein